MKNNLTTRIAMAAMAVAAGLAGIVRNRKPRACHPGEPIYIRPSDPNDPNSSSGVAIEDELKLLTMLNVPGFFAHGLEDLKTALDQGQGVIAEVNEEILLGLDEMEDPKHPDHVLMVIGYDPATKTVHFNDGAAEDGRDEQVPLDRFMKAWETGGTTMIITEDAAN